MGPECWGGVEIRLLSHSRMEELRLCLYGSSGIGILDLCLFFYAFLFGKRAKAGTPRIILEYSLACFLKTPCQPPNLAP